MRIRSESTESRLGAHFLEIIGELGNSDGRAGRRSGPRVGRSCRPAASAVEHASRMLFSTSRRKFAAPAEGALFLPRACNGTVFVEQKSSRRDAGNSTRDACSTPERLRRPVPLSPCHLVPLSPCPLVTLSPCLLVLSPLRQG
jgi:hypothetical protein